MIRALRTTFKRVVAYHFTSYATRSENLREFLLVVIRELESIGFRVLIVVCDMAGSNQSVWKSLGIEFHKEPVRSFISNPFSPDRNIYFCPDIPHLLKNLANAIRRHDLIAPGDRIVSFESVRTLFEVQKSNVYPLAEKLNISHLEPNQFQKMKVNIASQTLSNSVAASLFLLSNRMARLRKIFSKSQVTL